MSARAPYSICWNSPTLFSSFHGCYQRIMKWIVSIISHVSFHQWIWCWISRIILFELGFWFISRMLWTSCLFVLLELWANYGKSSFIHFCLCHSLHRYDHGWVSNYYYDWVFFYIKSTCNSMTVNWKTHQSIPMNVSKMDYRTSLLIHIIFSHALDGHGPQWIVFHHWLEFQIISARLPVSILCFQLTIKQSNFNCNCFILVSNKSCQDISFM